MDGSVAASGVRRSALVVIISRGIDGSTPHVCQKPRRHATAPIPLQHAASNTRRASFGWLCHYLPEVDLSQRGARPSLCQSFHRTGQLKPHRSGRNTRCRARRDLVVRASIQDAAVPSLLDTAPLLEEESGLRAHTALTNGFNPLALHGSRAGTAFAANDYPIDPSQVHLAEVLKKGLDTEETRAGMRVP